MAKKAHTNTCGPPLGPPKPPTATRCCTTPRTLTKRTIRQKREKVDSHMWEISLFPGKLSLARTHFQSPRESRLSNFNKTAKIKLISAKLIKGRRRARAFSFKFSLFRRASHFVPSPKFTNIHILVFVCMCVCGHMCERKNQHPIVGDPTDQAAGVVAEPKTNQF